MASGDAVRAGSPDSDSLERIVPLEVQAGDATGAETIQLHLERYEFAARHACPGRALDLACGVGYGTRLLVDRNPKIVEALGVDRSIEAISYARTHYGSERVRFSVDDAFRFVDERGFDTVVSIETLEHLPDPARFAARLVELLRPGGVLIGSLPVTPSVDVNLHHLHDFTERSFRRLFEGRGLVERERLSQVQPFSPVAALTRRERRMRELRTNLPIFYLTHPRSLARRMASVLRYGFSNRYLTVAWERTA